MTVQLPRLQDAKAQAKSLRAGTTGISHAQALEQIAKKYGFRDWNSLHAAIIAEPLQSLAAGARVGGRYLGHRFQGEIIRTREIGAGFVTLEIQFDHPVDTVCFTSFQNMRSRVTATIGPDGYSKERTSDGVPHLVLDTENLLT
ncbi:hypothetical protein SAMN04488005_2127 [Yoonia tamlensis]|uniref:Glyoxalase-related protein domain-containing protein n=1 Tax=Yoonia tamlensis TaxID=390270 RepID=A0A1I6GTB2_9RHOB|nr:glyoxalase superfamily protein [Yoonia tamlensis]SFR45321.1 hypothetical protein SAMN04488005_2127 [Yoonia tamlensis]